MELLVREMMASFAPFGAIANIANYVLRKDIKSAASFAKALASNMRY